jgi:predicted nucleic acid-binding Zn ribbon protein
MGYSREGVNEPRRVAISLSEAARLMGAPGAAELARVREMWPEMVGLQAAAHAFPKAFSRGALTVATDHHAWANEFRLLASDLLERLQAKCPSVRSIVVVVSPTEGPNW